MGTCLVQWHVPPSHPSHTMAMQLPPAVAHMPRPRQYHCHAHVARRCRASTYHPTCQDAPHQTPQTVPVPTSATHAAIVCQPFHQTGSNLHPVYPLTDFPTRSTQDPPKIHSRSTQDPPKIHTQDPPRSSKIHTQDLPRSTQDWILSASWVDLGWILVDLGWILGRS